MPPTAVATIGRPFHIASATVSPKPSAMLFCTTTDALRCSALTITAFSSASSIGRQTRWTLRRASSLSDSRSSIASCEHLGALGVVGDRLDRRARVDQVRAGLVRRGVLGEPADHALRDP